MVTTLARNSKNLLPADPIDQEFAALFPHLWDWIFKDADGWHTNSKYPLSPRDLIEKWRSPNEIIGVRFCTETNRLVIDLDLGSQYHPANDEQGYKKILGVMEGIGLAGYILMQSSNSTGLHLYFPLPESVNSFNLACASRHALEKAGLTVKGGTLEIFPNVKAYSDVTKTLFNGHRLPLQEGSYLLDSNYEPYSQSIESFLIAWKNAADSQDMKILNKAIATAPRPKNIKTEETGKGTTWRSNLESRIATGWTGKGQTNELMFQIAQYGRVFLGIDDLSQLAEYTTTKSKSCNGFYEYSSHAHEVDRLALDKAKNVMATYYPYGSKSGLTSGDLNAKTKEPKVSRLEQVKQALIDLLAEIGDRVFRTTRELLKFLAKSLKSSNTTLGKFKELWQPLLKNCNAASSNEYSDFDVESNEVCGKVEIAETIAESGVTVTAPNEVLLHDVEARKAEQSQVNPQIGVSKFSLETSEPLPDNEFKPIMTFNQAVAIASTCPSPPMPESSKWHKPKEPPRENPSTLENIKVIVTADPSRARSQLAKLKAKLILPWLKGEERSQTEAAIVWLQDFIDMRFF
ncbi:MAG: hypothetical protein DCF20_09880 [Pseudanabaena sp.]|nr:MAG: hypothetical protein DCF20_09880 [Pseudanabaena sp.]